MIAETAIDAISYAAVYGFQQTRFLSVAGQLGPTQLELLAAVINKMKAGSTIVTALDHDEGGDSLFQQIRSLFEDLDRCDLKLIDHRPETVGQDWNDVLIGKSINSPTLDIEP